MPQTPTAPFLPPLTREQRDAYVQLVQQHGAERARNFGRRFAEDDYLMGAGVIFEAAGAMGQLPASWTFGLMARRSPCTGRAAEPTPVRCAWRRCQAIETAYIADVPEGWIALDTSQGRGAPVPFCSWRCLSRHAVGLAKDEARDKRRPGRLSSRAVNPPPGRLLAILPHRRLAVDASQYTEPLDRIAALTERLASLEMALEHHVGMLEERIARVDDRQGRALDRLRDDLEYRVSDVERTAKDLGYRVDRLQYR